MQLACREPDTYTVTNLMAAMPGRLKSHNYARQVVFKLRKHGWLQPAESRRGSKLKPTSKAYKFLNSIP